MYFASGVNGSVDAPDGEDEFDEFDGDLPKSELGDAIRNGPNAYALGHDLIRVKFDPGERILYLESFFHLTALPDRDAANQQVARMAGSRTLGGVGMEWVRAMAVKLDAAQVSLSDSYRGRDSRDSVDLREAAQAELAASLLVEPAPHVQWNLYRLGTSNIESTHVRVHTMYQVDRGLVVG
jgi:hypothetical protein